MKKRMVGLLLAMVMCVTLCVPSFAISAEDSEIDESGFSVSEYEMVLNAQQDWIAAQGIQVQSENAESTPAPLEEFQKSFDARAKLPTDVLKGYGYSDEKISILKQYEKGEIPFEVAAMSASARLVGNIYCGTHMATKYSLTYEWEWDVLPNGLGRDGFGLGLQGIDNQSDGFNTKIDSSAASVTYYYMTGTRYRAENVSKSPNTNTISATFDSYKLTDSGDRWVWAKSGYLTMTISPTVSGGKQFAAVRARGEYSHSSNDKIDLNLAISVDVISGNITFAASISNGKSGNIQQCGIRQIVFYNDGSYHEEV